MTKITKALLCAAVAFSVGGCASTGTTDGQKQGKELGKDLRSCTQALAKLETDIKAVLASHDAIINNTDGDYAGHYKTFGKGLDKVEKSRQTARARYDEVNATAGAYFASWKSGAESFSSDSMREKSEKLLQKMQKEFGDIWEDAPGARKAFTELTKILGDHRLFWTPIVNQSTAAEMKKDEKKIKGAKDTIFTAIAEASKAAAEFEESINPSVKTPEKSTGATAPASGPTKSGTTKP